MSYEQFLKSNQKKSNFELVLSLCAGSNLLIFHWQLSLEINTGLLWLSRVLECCHSENLRKNNFRFHTWICSTNSRFVFDGLLLLRLKILYLLYFFIDFNNVWSISFWIIHRIFPENIRFELQLPEDMMLRMQYSLVSNRIPLNKLLLFRHFHLLVLSIDIKIRFFTFIVRICRN